MIIGYVFWGLIIVIAMVAIAAVIVFLINNSWIFWVIVAAVSVTLLIEATRR